MYLFVLKSVFHFILQCTLVPYLENGLCKLVKQLDNCNFTLIYPRNIVSKVAKIRKRYNQVPHLTQDTNGKVTNSQKTAYLLKKVIVMCVNIYFLD